MSQPSRINGFQRQCCASLLQSIGYWVLGKISIEFSGGGFDPPEYERFVTQSPVPFTFVTYIEFRLIRAIAILGVMSPNP
ncbi:hypothetical protein I8752_27405 [Nostocaceae cyanobacterium CENA369]|uniref:Uncharacterized protein n=1 Tax=Dendronalium phyllosphericum CENA369 TaxID=1725256 RepID=A0A8J7IDB7_9NOST|nr:hypothetical protein [Dendronalium phyllosphericum]MBH8576650.1 hypothetical protein [Dendronalium phyllosphericum CENA369]